MSYRATLEVSLATLRALLDYQAERANNLALADLADLADGTKLRISSSSGKHYADVVCGELIYEGAVVSPNQFVTASLHNVGNAWKVICVQLPGDTDWTPALRLRHAAMAHAFRTARRKAERTAPPVDPATG